MASHQGVEAKVSGSLRKAQLEPKKASDHENSVTEQSMSTENIANAIFNIEKNPLESSFKINPPKTSMPKSNIQNLDDNQKENSDVHFDIILTSERPESLPTVPRYRDSELAKLLQLDDAEMISVNEIIDKTFKQDQVFFKLGSTLASPAVKEHWCKKIQTNLAKELDQHIATKLKSQDRGRVGYLLFQLVKKRKYRLTDHGGTPSSSTGNRSNSSRSITDEILVDVAKAALNAEEKIRVQEHASGLDADGEDTIDLSGSVSVQKHRHALTTTDGQNSPRPSSEVGDFHSARQSPVTTRTSTRTRRRNARNRADIQPGPPEEKKRAGGRLETFATATFQAWIIIVLLVVLVVSSSLTLRILLKQQYEDSLLGYGGTDFRYEGR
ncbi:hypothetical protein AA313_de0210376 [Arthrobotrys entomopaga]|nr:hypothetical protein AA313_de0210376 [Arthrobotrys entomopaga]